MNSKQAIAKLRPIIGKQFAYREDKTAPTPEQREKIRAEWAKARDAAQAAEEARQARYAELMRDPLYQELAAKAKAAKQARDDAGAGLHRHRVTVGRLGSMFFSIEAEGDNWAEVVEKVTTKASA